MPGPMTSIFSGRQDTGAAAVKVWLPGASAALPYPSLPGYPGQQYLCAAAPVADQPQVMTINFMGLTGPSGALPTRYTEMLLERRLQHRDQTAHHFFDLLNHRLITLFYQAWRKHQATADLACGLQADWRQMLLSWPVWARRDYKTG